MFQNQYWRIWIKRIRNLFGKKIALELDSKPKLFKSNGGLKLQNLQHNFWAAQMKYLVVWIQDDSNTQWLNTERNMCPDPLWILPFLDTPTKELAEWTKITLKIWRKIQAAFGLPKLISPRTSIAFMKRIKPNVLDIRFRKWSDHRLFFYISQLMVIISSNLNSWKMNLTSLGQISSDIYS